MTLRVRTLDQVKRDGDERWFAAVVEEMAALRMDQDERLRGFFELDVSVMVARAPGRLDVMGGIADYSGATVLQLPLARATTVIAQRQRRPQFDVATRRAGAWELFSMDVDMLSSATLADPRSLAAWLRTTEDCAWASYVIGCMWHVLRRSPANPSQPAGVRILIDSTVPEGKGVSSSAALEVAVLSVVAATYGIGMDPEELATACQWVENHIVGAPCGIMDQMTSACGRTDRLLRLKCQPDQIEGYLEIPNGFQFFGIDSGLRHAVTGADYGTVRTAAFMGYRIIADAAGLSTHTNDDSVQVDDPYWHGYLANITPGEFDSRFRSILPERIRGADFLARYGGTTDRVTRVAAAREYPVLDATMHPIYEQDRVRRFADLLAELRNQPSLACDLGALMYESHASYSACGLGSDGTDRLVELVREAGPSHGLFGAKITGGGSGGTVAVLAEATAGGAVADIAHRYSLESGRESEVFADSGPGADQMGILILE